MPMNFSARALLAATVAGSAILSGCHSLPPTPYRAAPPGDGTYGYSTMHIEGDIYRIDFYGSPATPSRTAKAFAFYRAAELAEEFNAPAFRIVQGEVDRSILDGTEIFSWSDSFPELPLGRLAVNRESGIDAATLQKVAGTTYIPVPIYITPPGQAQRYADEKQVSKLTILRAQMLRELPASLDDRTFLTREVLNKLGPRIVRAKSA